MKAMHESDCPAMPFDDTERKQKEQPKKGEAYG